MIENSNTLERGDIFFLDREWYDVNGNRFSGDLQWSFEEADSYRSYSGPQEKPFMGKGSGNIRDPYEKLQLS